VSVLKHRIRLQSVTLEALFKSNLVVQGWPVTRACLLLMTRNLCLILLIGSCTLQFASAQNDKGPGDKKEKVDQKKKDGAGRPDPKGLSPEERDAKRKEMRERMQKQLGELRKKKADGTLTEADKRRLERMEEVEKRFDQTGPAGGPAKRNGKEIKDK